MIRKTSLPLQVIIFSVSIFCFGCANVYIPASRNVPLLEKRGDFQVSGSVGTGVNAQIAYSPVKYVAISGSAFYANDEWWRHRNFHRHHAFESALGFYIPKRSVIIELFAGYARGGGDAQEKHGESIFSDSWMKTFHGDYQKYFIQPTVCWKIPPLIQVAFTARIAKVDFSDFQFTTQGYVPYRTFRTDGFFFEPCGTFKIYPLRRSEKFFAYAQIGAAQPLFYAKESFYNFLQLNAGAGIRLGRK